MIVFEKDWEKSQKGDLSSVKFPEFNSGENLATRKAWGPILDSICDSFDFLGWGISRS